MTIVRYKQGKLTEAMDLYQEALGMRLRALGKDHADVSIAYNNVAMVHTDQGQLGKAAMMHQKALKIQLKSLGQDHILTATTYDNLAHVLHITYVPQHIRNHYKQGGLGEAAELCQKALDIGLKVLEHDDPFIAEAQELMEQIQVDVSQSMGTVHP